MALGSGTYEIALYDRGGSKMLGMLRDVETLHWDRKRDDISEARVVVNGAYASSNTLRAARTVRHELVVFRDGERVWEGPVTRIEYDQDRVELDAKDLLWFTSRTATTTHAKYTNDKTPPTVVDVAETLLGMTFDRGGDWLRAWKYRKKYRHRLDRKFEGEWVGYSETVYDVLERLAQDWDLDYACVGRRIYWNDVHVRIAYTLPMTDDHFEGALVVTEYGSEVETRRFASGEKKVQVRTAPQALIDYYGYIDMIGTALDEEVEERPALPPVPHKTKPVLENAGAPLQVRLSENSQVSPKAPVSIERLVPGMWIPVRTDRVGRPIDAWMKVNEVNVDWAPLEGEKVHLSVQPAPVGGMHDPE